MRGAVPDPGVLANPLRIPRLAFEHGRLAGNGVQQLVRRMNPPLLVAEQPLLIRAAERLTKFLDGITLARLELERSSAELLAVFFPSIGGKSNYSYLPVLERIRGLKSRDS